LLHVQLHFDIVIILLIDSEQVDPNLKYVPIYSQHHIVVQWCFSDRVQFNTDTGISFVDLPFGDLCGVANKGQQFCSDKSAFIYITDFLIMLSFSLAWFMRPHWKSFRNNLTCYLWACNKKKWFRSLKLIDSKIWQL
jgi:hypothetical protein